MLFITTFITIIRFTLINIIIINKIILTTAESKIAINFIPKIKKVIILYIVKITMIKKTKSQ